MTIIYLNQFIIHFLAICVHTSAWKGFSHFFPLLSGDGIATSLRLFSAGISQLHMEALPMPLKTATELRDELDRLSPAAELEMWRAQGEGRGLPSHRADLRLFDAPNDFEPLVTLFRDRAAWCPYCEKVGGIRKLLFCLKLMSLYGRFGSSWRRSEFRIARGCRLSQAMV